MKTHTTSGITVTEYDEPDTEDITITALPNDALAAKWEALADAYAANEHCPGCMWDERGFNVFTQRSWHECHCTVPDACPAINPKSIANALRRQAS